MSKKVLGLGLGLVLILACYPVYAQEEDSITITTYYPSPYGVYNELQSYKFAVGDTNGDNKLTSADQPDADGQIYAARGVIFKPQDPLPSSDVEEGELVYSSSDKGFHYYDGAAWFPQAGGGGGAVLTLVGSDNVCVNCPDGWDEVLYGYWNCAVAGGIGGLYCFCGQRAYYSTTGGWSASAQESGASYYRCRVCVK